MVHRIKTLQVRLFTVVEILYFITIFKLFNSKSTHNLEPIRSNHVSGYEARRTPRVSVSCSNSAWFSPLESARANKRSPRVKRSSRR